MKNAVITYNPGPGGETGHLGRWLSARGFTITLASRDEPMPLDLADHADLLISLGSLWSVARPMDRPGDEEHAAGAVEAELALLRRRLDAGLPTLGVCFGGQLLCRAIGGQVDHLPDGRFLAWHRADTTIEELAAPWFYIHEDHLRPPADAEVLAEADHATVAFRYGNAWGLQFHPEVDADVLQLWFADLAIDATIADRLTATASRRASANSDEAFALFDRFWNDATSRTQRSVA